MTEWTIRVPTIKDVEAIAEGARDADREEWRLSVVGGLDNLLLSVRQSAERWTLVAGERPVALGGVVEDYHRAITWMLGTPEGEALGFEMMASAGLREWLTRFFERWPRTECYSHVENTVHHRWLSWWGYREEARLPWGPYDAPFILFIKEP